MCLIRIYFKTKIAKNKSKLSFQSIEFLATKYLQAIITEKGYVGGLIICHFTKKQKKQKKIQNKKTKKQKKTLLVQFLLSFIFIQFYIAKCSFLLLFNTNKNEDFNKVFNTNKNEDFNKVPLTCTIYIYFQNFTGTSVICVQESYCVQQITVSNTFSVSSSLKRPHSH